MKEEPLMSKPNVIFLIQDQMQQRVLDPASGCRMPNLRSLMADSVVFEQAHTCNAICSPARASLVTGVLPHVHGMVDCTHTVPPYRAEYDETLDTVTRAFHDEGYYVSYFGKWHIERTHDLHQYGIDEFETELDMPSRQVTMADKIMVRTPGYPDKMVGGVFAEGEGITDENYVYRKGMAAIETARKQGRPFCALISTNAPHDPYCVPKEVYDLYEGDTLSLPESFRDSLADRPAIYRRMRSALAGLTEADFLKTIRCYYAYCTLVDIQIGRLVRYLKENGLYDDTLIVCTSDHGDMMGAHGMMMKSVESFEEIYHIPLVMKLPGQRRAGEKKDFYMSTTEIAPTLLDLAGCRPLANKYAGESVVPWIEGKKTDRRSAYSEFFGQRFSFTQRIVWQDGFKYVFNAFDYDEFYDLTADPHELRNLTDDPAYAEKKKELCKKMWKTVIDTDDSSLADAGYFLMRFAPVGPGPKKAGGNYSLYNKVFG